MNGITGGTRGPVGGVRRPETPRRIPLLETDCAGNGERN